MPRLSFVPCFALALVSWTASADTETIFVPAEAAYDRYGKFHESVKKQCDTARVIASAVAEYNANVKLSRTPQEEERHLEILVYQLSAQGGMGADYVVGVRGRLLEDGVVTATFNGSRSYARDPFGYFGPEKGTCGVVGRVARRVGRDIAEFLTHPSVGAKIGDP